MDIVGVIFALLVAAIWGIVYTLDQKILTFTSPLTWLALQSFFGAILLSPVLFFRFSEINQIFRLTKYNLFIVILTLLLVILGTYLIFLAINRLGAAKANIFEISYPFFVVIFSFFLFNDKFSPFFWIGAGLIFLGSVIIIRLS